MSNANVDTLIKVKTKFHAKSLQFIIRQLNLQSTLLFGHEVDFLKNIKEEKPATSCMRKQVIQMSDSSSRKKIFAFSINVVEN